MDPSNAAMNAPSMDASAKPFQPISHDYHFDRVIGQGAYGTVHAARRQADGEAVVIKEVAVASLDADDDWQSRTALQEAHTLAKFSHANIIQYYEARWNDGTLYIVMEMAEAGDLADLIQQQAQQRRYLSEDQIMLWFVQMCLALWHVHSRGMLHRDLKPQNIFIGSSGVLKLGDFGIAQMLESGSDQSRTMMGTPSYLAPEICSTQPYSTKSDVWALGCVLYEVAMLKRAFDAPSLPALVVKIVQGKIAPISTNFSSSFQSLVRSMLSQAPAKRPSMDAILKLPWLRRHLERFADMMIPISYEQLAAQPAPTASTAEPAAAQMGSTSTPEQHQDRKCTDDDEQDSKPEQLDSVLSSLSSISSHPVQSAQGAVADSPPVRNAPFAALEQERTLRHHSKTPQKAEPQLQTLPPPGHLRARTSGHTSRSTTATGSSDKAGSAAACAPIDAAAQPNSASSPSLSCAVPPASSPGFTIWPAGTDSNAEVVARRQLHASWVAGNLAQLNELELELDKCSPIGSPSRRRAQRQHHLFELSEPDGIEQSPLSPRDRCMSDAALAQQAHVPLALRSGGEASSPPVQQAAVPLERQGQAAFTKAERAHTEPAQGLPTLQQAFAVRRAEHKAHLQQQAERREERQRGKQAAQRQHKAALRRAKPQVHRQTLQEMGQAFAKRGENTVTSKSAIQQAQAPSFIVCAPEAERSRRGSERDHSMADAPNQSRTRRAMQAQSSAAHENSRNNAAAKPWRQRSIHRNDSAEPSVEIFAPACKQHNAACNQNSSIAASTSVQQTADISITGEVAGGVCMRSPVERLSQLRELTTSFEAVKRSDADGSPDTSPLGRRHAALSDVQAFLDSDAAVTMQGAHTRTHDAHGTDQCEGTSRSCGDTDTSAHEMGSAARLQAHDAFSAASAQDVEELRLKLEVQLGADMLVRACDHVQLHQQEGKDVDSVREELHHLVGRDSEHVSAVLELMLMEQAAFGRM